MDVHRSLRISGLALSLGVVACGNDVGIYDLNGGVGRGDAPSLATPTRTDVVTQTTVPAVDILWVVDNSCSMVEEQDELKNNFAGFIQFFLDSGLDWHIGVVSTDTVARGHSGKLRPAAGYRYLTPDTPEPEALFGQMVTLGTNGSADERGIDAAWRALAQPNPDLQNTNAGFYREDAALHVVVISDEDDFSTAQGPNEFANFLLGLKSSEDIPVTFSSIVGPRPRGCSNRQTDASVGDDYITVTELVGGIHESICVGDWYPVMEQLGLEAAGLRDEYFLAELPVAESIELRIVEGKRGKRITHGINLDTKPAKPTLAQVCAKRGHDTCVGFVYDPARNSVVLPDYVPNALSKVEIEYELLSELQIVEDTDVLSAEDAEE